MNLSRAVMKTLSPAASAAIVLLVAPAAAAREPEIAAPADWGAALAGDARAFRDVIADSHPGPVDVENPGFETWVPAHAWTGTLSDTAGIEAWIAGLDAAAAQR